MLNNLHKPDIQGSQDLEQQIQYNNQSPNYVKTSDTHSSKFRIRKQSEPISFRQLEDSFEYLQKKCGFTKKETQLMK